MRLLIADDHDLVRETIAAFLMREGLSEVSQAATLDEALTLVATQEPFDLVLLDYNMPGMNGLEGMQKMKEASGAAVAILSGLATRDIAEAALRAGAAGFVPKTLSAQSMVSGIRCMVAGETFVPYGFLSSEASSIGASGVQLTRREAEVLRGIAEGKSNKEIARDCDLQEVTVKLHVKTLCRKLGAKNRTHAAMIARNEGLV